MEKFNVYAKNGKLLDKLVTADYIKEEYETKNPWRYAKKSMLLHGKYVLRVVEE